MYFDKNKYEKIDFDNVAFLCSWLYIHLQFLMLLLALVNYLRIGDCTKRFGLYNSANYIAIQTVNIGKHGTNLQGIETLKLVYSRRNLRSTSSRHRHYLLRLRITWLDRECLNYNIFPHSIWLMASLKYLYRNDKVIFKD